MKIMCFWLFFFHLFIFLCVHCCLLPAVDWLMPCCAGEWNEFIRRLDLSWFFFTWPLVFHRSHKSANDSNLQRGSQRGGAKQAKSITKLHKEKMHFSDCKNDDQGYLIKKKFVGSWSSCITLAYIWYSATQLFSLKNRRLFGKVYNNAGRDQVIDFWREN